MELNKEKLQEILTKQREEYQTYLGTVAEDFLSQVRTIAELTTGIQGQLEAIRDMVAQNTGDIEVIKMDVQVIKLLYDKP